MKSNQKGFNVVEIIIVIVVLGLLGTAGWLIYDRQKDKAASQETTTQTNQESTKQTDNEDSTATKKIDTTIHDVDIKMQTASDINKLPDYTPASFKAYMLDILQKNKYYSNSAGGVDTIEQYEISKISQVNIVGGQAPVDKNGEGYPGGAPIIWVLTPAGTWDKQTLNAPSCKSENGGLIYEEFVKECYAGSNTDSLVKNPNGSIKSLAQ